MTTVSVCSEVLADPVEDAIESVRVGVIEKVDIHRIGRLAERVGDELRPKGGTADADEQNMFEAFALFAARSSSRARRPRIV